jgi:hypothetical protein
MTALIVLFIAPALAGGGRQAIGKARSFATRYDCGQQKLAQTRNYRYAFGWSKPLGVAAKRRR